MSHRNRASLAASAHQVSGHTSPLRAVGVRRLRRSIGAVLATACLLACGSGMKPPVVDQSRAAQSARSGGGGVVTVAGEVLGVDRVPASQQNQLTLRLKVTPDSTRPILVRFGPGWHLSERGLVFEPNEAIQVRGESRVVNGRSVLVATEMDKNGQHYMLSSEPAEPPEGAGDAPTGEPEATD